MLKHINIIATKETNDLGNIKKTKIKRKTCGTPDTDLPSICEKHQKGREMKCSKFHHFIKENIFYLMLRAKKENEY